MKATRKEGMCPVKWNPGTWPYVTHCEGPTGHQGDHYDAEDRRIPNLGKRQEQASEEG